MLYRKSREGMKQLTICWHRHDTYHEAREPIQGTDWIRMYRVIWRPECCHSGVTTIQERLRRLEQGVSERFNGTVHITVQNDAHVLARSPFAFTGHFASLDDLRKSALHWGQCDIMRPCRINDTVMFDMLTGAGYRAERTWHFRVEQVIRTDAALLLSLRRLEAWNAGLVPTTTILDQIPASAVRFTVRQEHPRRIACQES